MAPDAAALAGAAVVFVVEAGAVPVGIWGTLLADGGGAITGARSSTLPVAPLGTARARSFDK